MTTITKERIQELLSTMQRYHSQNEELRQHVIDDEWRNTNALKYSNLWADLTSCLDMALASMGSSQEPVAFRHKLKTADEQCEWNYTSHRAPDEFELERCKIEWLYAAPQPAPVVQDIGEIRVGRLPTMNQDEYPGLGDWWVQLRIGDDYDEVLARVYGATPQEANNRAEALVCRAAMLQSEPVSNRDELPEEKGSSLQLRNLIRQRHAEWSEKTFGNVGPVGPLKHLSKEALEAAAEPDDLSEWADMQFLLWDAQRRAGISDGEITAAMEEKLKVNMARQWPEPKDGEPRLHIKEAGNSSVTPDGWVMVPKEPTESMIIYGFESEPDEFFSKSEDWEAYQDMSGCEQAAHRAKLCWAAMIAAAPQQE